MIISNHGKKRIVERVNNVNSISEAKKNAKIAFHSGKTISYYQSKPNFYEYLRARKHKSNSCTIRVYNGNIYIWRGKHKTLVTAHKIPERFLEELEGEKE